MTRLAIRPQRTPLIILLLALLWLGRGLPVHAGQGQVGGSFSVVQPDQAPPTRIVDLAVVNRTSTSVALTWTAPSDEGPSGRAARYDLRYALAPIATWGDWLNATPLPSTPKPGTPETFEEMTVPGLEPDTRYYFVITSVDDAGYWAALSPCAQGVTQSPVGGKFGYTLSFPLVRSGAARAPQGLPLIMQK